MVLKAENLYKSFGRKKVLQDLSLELQPATICGVVGENGSGKSSLLKILVGEWKADKGRVKLEGRMGYCPQQVTLYSQLTVDEHFRYFGAAYGMASEELHERRQHLLDYFNFGKYHRETVAHLSGGTAQKLNLCLALLHDPDLLILDEPYNGFDWDTYSRFWEYLDQLKNSSCCVLVVSHFITEKGNFDRIYTLKNGRLE